MKLSLATLLYLSFGANASDEGGVRGGAKKLNQEQGRQLQPPFDNRWTPTASPSSSSFETCVRECKEDSSGEDGGATTDILLLDVTPLASCSYGKPYICPSSPTWCVDKTCCDDSKPPTCKEVRRSHTNLRF